MVREGAVVATVTPEKQFIGSGAKVLDRGKSLNAPRESHLITGTAEVSSTGEKALTFVGAVSSCLGYM